MKKEQGHKANINETRELMMKAPLKKGLFKEYFKFTFFKAVHLLEIFSPDKRNLGRTHDPREEPVRFLVKPGLNFPPSDISGLEQAGSQHPAEMQVTFMGLIGPAGLLPHWYNELALERVKRKDFSLSAFLDIFHHRLISSFYLAWKKHRIPENYIRGASDKHSGYLLSLMGLGTHGLSEGLELPREPLLFYSGLLTRTIPSASNIAAAVEYFSNAGAAVKQFIDRIVPLAREDQTQLGKTNSCLGENSVCGSYTWENQTKFRVEVGPMKYNRFILFLPEGDMLTRIFSLVRYMSGIEYEFEIRLILERKETPPCVIGTTGLAAPRLGWSTWINTAGVSYAEDPHVNFQSSRI